VELYLCSPNKSSWRGAQLSTRTTLPLSLKEVPYIVRHCGSSLYSKHPSTQLVRERHTYKSVPSFLSNNNPRRGKNRRATQKSTECISEVYRLSLLDSECEHSRSPEVEPPSEKSHIHFNSSKHTSCSGII